MVVQSNFSDEQLTIMYCKVVDPVLVVKINGLFCICGHYSYRNTACTMHLHIHGQGTPREAIAFTALPKINSQSQIFRYDRSIFCLPHRPKFSDTFDLCLHWVIKITRAAKANLSQTRPNILPQIFLTGCFLKERMKPKT